MSTSPFDDGVRDPAAADAGIPVPQPWATYPAPPQHEGGRHAAPEPPTPPPPGGLPYAASGMSVPPPAPGTYPPPAPGTFPPPGDAPAGHHARPYVYDGAGYPLADQSSGGPFDAPFGAGDPPKGRRRTFVAVTAAVGVLALVGTAYAGARVVGWAAGGGPQPEEVLPTSTVAFAKIDLNPSAGQKLDAIRFFAKLPMSPDPLKKADANTDLRKAVVEAIQDAGGLTGLHYDTDLAPWLGDRMGVGLLPADDDANPHGAAVVVLAVSDTKAASAHLAAVGKAVGGSCSLDGSFAVCAQSATTVSHAIAAAQAHPLSDNPDFRTDLGALGEDGVVTLWSDLGAAEEAAGPAMGALGLGSFGSVTPDAATATPSAASAFSGRVAAALRFSGASLEIAGHASGLTTVQKTSAHPTSVGSLPKDTVAAFGISGLGDQVEASWPDILDAMTSLMGRSAATSAVTDAENQLGISIPGDLSSSLGNDLAVAYGGLDGDTPKIAVRTDADPKVLDRLLRSSGAQSGLAVVKGTKATVLSTDKAYAAAVASGSGLGSTAAFRDAVPDAARAQVVGYLDIPKLLSSTGSSMSASDKKDLASFAALGLSMTTSQGAADFRLRLTTR